MKFVPEGSVEIPSIPIRSEVVIPASKSAIVIVDMQNDFVSEGGLLVVPSARDTVDTIRTLIDRSREHGVHIIYTMDTHFENDPEWKIWGEHCRHGTWGWHIIDALTPAKDDLIVYKNRYDGFYGTWLEHFLSSTWDIQHLVIVGTMSNVCVLHTAASAGLRWYHVVVPANGISTLTDFDQAATLRQVSWLYVGDIVRSAEGIQFEP